MNGKNFIYVFDTESRDKLLNAGYFLVTVDKSNSIFVFASNNNLNFSFDGIDHVISDTLSF